MKKYVLKYKKLLILGVILSTITSSINILLSFAMGRFTNYAIKQDLKYVIIWSLITVGSLVVASIFQASEFAVRTSFCTKCVLSLKKDIYTMLINQDMSKRKNDDMTKYISLLQTDSGIVQTSYFENIVGIISLIIKIILSSIALLLLDYKLFVVFILISSLSSVVIPIFKKNLSKKKGEIVTRSDEYIKTVKGFVLGLDTLIYNLKENTFLTTLLEKDKKFENAKKESKIWDATLSISSMSVGMLSQLLSMIFAAYLISIGEITVGVMITATQLLNFVVPPVSQLNHRLTEYKSVKELIKKFEDLIASYEKPTNKEFINGNIVYKDFSINGVHDKFNYTFEKGKHYVILGKTGSGKSLLLKSLIGKFSDYEGEISINNIPVKEIKRNTFYENVKYSSQEGHIFDTKLEDNISLGDTIYVNEIIEKLDLKNIPLDKENLNESLSGGEKQRINLARVLVREAQIYLFDEPTSALDPNTTKIVEDMISSLKDKTVIVISHKWDEEYLAKFDGVIKL